MVKVYCRTNVAVTVLAASMVMVVGFVEPVNAPLQPVTGHPDAAVAVNVTIVPCA